MNIVQEFDKRHDKSGRCLQHNGWWYWPDGACREYNPLGALMEPPADDKARLRNIATYHRAAVARAVRAFDEAKEAALGDPMNADEQELRKLQAAVKDARAAEAEAEEALRFAVTGRTLEEERQLQQMEADHRAERQRRRAVLDGIKV
jgi:hypothetical protein